MVKSLTYRKVIFFLLFIISLISLSLVGLSSYRLSYAKIENLIGERLESIAATASLALNSKQHSKVVIDIFRGKKNIDQGEAFKTFQAQLQKIKEVNKLKQDIYTVIINPMNKDQMLFTTMSSKKTYIGNVMDVHPLVKQVYENKRSYHTSIYEDEEGKWISGFAPIFNKKNKVKAVLEIDFDVNEEIKLIKKELRESLIPPFIVILFLTTLLAIAFSKKMTAPLDQLLKKVANLRRNQSQETLIANSNIKEFQLLHNEFDNMANTILDSRQKLEDYAQNLEDKVEKRTAELKKSQNDIQNILNNVSQGFLTFDQDGIVGDDHSQVVETIFETTPAKKPFTQLINKFSPFNASDFYDWRDLAYAGTIDFDSLVELLPSQFINSKNQSIYLSYHPIIASSGELKKVICISEDKTQEVKLKNQSLENEEYAKFIINLMNNRDIFEDYCIGLNNQILKCVQIVNKELPLEHSDIDSLSRYVHTIKGESAFNHIHKNVLLSEKIEDEIKIFKDNKHESETEQKQSLKNIQLLLTEMHDSFERFLDENSEIVSKKDDNVFVTKRNKNDIHHFFNLIDPEKKSKILIQKLKDFFILEDIGELLRRYEVLANDLSLKEGKNLSLSVTSDGSRVDLAKYNDFIKSCVHLIRNSIDHGIEPKEERISKNKAPEAKIMVDIKTVEEEGKKYLNFKFADDGRGINIEKIKQKILDQDLITQSDLEKLTEKEIIDYIFKPSFSTKKEQTHLSGRGVGLDAVKECVDALNGSIEVESEMNIGTTFYIKILHEEMKYVST